MRDIIIAIIVFGSLPYILMRPYVGVLIWTWIGIMNPHRLAYGFAYNFPFAAVIGAVTLLSLLFTKEKNRFPWTPVTVILLIFIMWMCFTTLFALIPDAAHDALIKVLKIQFMIFMTLYVMQTRERIHALAWVIVLSLGFYGAKGGIFTILGGGQYMVIGPDGSFIAGNTEIALALIMTLPLMRYLHLNTKNTLVRYGILAVMLLTSFSIVGSYSRGALLGGVAMCFFLWLKSRRRFALGVTAIILLPILFSAMPAKWHERMGTIKTYEKDQSSMGRINAWRFALNLTADHPIIGGGFDSFDPSLFKIYAPLPDDIQDAHSIYFEVLGHHGYVGLILFLTLGLLTWRSGSWVLRATKHRPDLKWAHDLVGMVQVCLVGYAVGGAFLGLAYFDLYYDLVALVVLTQVVVKRALKESPANVAEAELNMAKQPLSFVRKWRKQSGA